MKEELQPIKRSLQLAPLSREHHEGLLFVWKIRQGIRKEVVPQRIARFIEWFWQQHLQQHFKKEEELLPPLLAPGHPMVNRMLAEHRTLQELMVKLVPSPDYDALERLAGVVNDHIRFEERQLFAELEKAATPEQLRYLADHLHDRQEVPVWADEFWLREK